MKGNATQQNRGQAWGAPSTCLPVAGCTPRPRAAFISGLEDPPSASRLHVACTLVSKGHAGSTLPCSALRAAPPRPGSSSPSSISNEISPHIMTPAFAFFDENPTEALKRAHTHLNVHSKPSKASSVLELHGVKHSDSASGIAVQRSWVWFSKLPLGEGKQKTR